MSGDDDATSSSEGIQISAFADRRTAEALRLEVRRLAKSLGLEVGQIRVQLAREAAEEEQTGESG